jgi:hypothetical protein
VGKAINLKGQSGHIRLLTPTCFKFLNFDFGRVQSSKQLNRKCLHSLVWEQAAMFSDKTGIKKCENHTFYVWRKV